MDEGYGGAQPGGGSLKPTYTYTYSYICISYIALCGGAGAARGWVRFEGVVNVECIGFGVDTLLVVVMALTPRVCEIRDEALRSLVRDEVSGSMIRDEV